MLRKVVVAPVVAEWGRFRKGQATSCIAKTVKEALLTFYVALRADREIGDHVQRASISGLLANWADFIDDCLKSSKDIPLERPKLAAIEAAPLDIDEEVIWCAALIAALDAWAFTADAESADLANDIFYEETFDGQGLPDHQNLFQPRRLKLGGVTEVPHWIYRRLMPIDPAAPGMKQHLPEYVCFRHHRFIPSQASGRVVRANPLIRSVSGYRQLVERFNQGQRNSIYLGAYKNPRDATAMVSKTETDRSGRIVNYYFSQAKGIDHNQRRQELADHLKKAIDTQADIVLLPELTVSPGLVDELAIGLIKQDAISGGLLIVPGTFHVEEATDAPRKRTKRKVNRAQLLSGDGTLILTQDKLCVFVTTGSKLEPTIVEKEDIRGSRVVNILAIGALTVGIAICKDFISSLEDTPWLTIDVSLVLVPSMGDGQTAKEHGKCLNQLRTSRRGAAAISQECNDKQQPFWFGVFDGEATHLALKAIADNGNIVSAIKDIVPR